MKLTVSAILFLAIGTLTEAHNVRTGHTTMHEVKQERTKDEV